MLFCFLLSGGLAGLAGASDVMGVVGQLQTQISPDYGFAAIIVAFLGRLNPIGVIFAGLLLALSYIGGESVQIVARHLRQDRHGLPGHPAVLHSGLRHADPLPHPHRGGRAAADADGGLSAMDMLIAVILTIMTAATPLLLAALGELVVERSGVLNLGVEGMMVMGAVCGFGAALMTGSPWLALLAVDCRRHAHVAALRLSHPHAGFQPGGDRPCADPAGPRPFRP